jgi:hypothetical protein
MMLGMRWALVAAVACAGHRAESVRPQVTFCAAVTAADLDRAGRVAHHALLDVGAEKLRDATEPLAAWLRTQPCVATVRVPAEVIDTEPGIRAITFTLVPDDAGVVRMCSADLRLAPGARVGVRPAKHVTNNPDRRCSP